MKTPQRTKFIRAVILLFAAAAAYWFGWSRGSVPAKVDIVSKKAGSSAPLVSPVTAAPVAGNPKSPSRLAADRALEQWKSSLTNPGYGKPPDIKLLNGINPADYPYLFDQLAMLPPSGSRDWILQPLILRLMHRDPATALSEVDLLTDSKTRSDMTNRTLGTMLSMDPAQGLAALAKLASGEQTQATYLGAFQAWAGASLDGGAAAAASAAALPPSSEQIAALQGAASGWAHNDPQAALDWASTLPSADAAVQQAAVTVAGESYPYLATPYLDKLTNASARNQAIQDISLYTAHKDPAGTLAWLDQVATGDTYDKSVVNVIAWLAVNKPATATALLATVTEPGGRGSIHVGSRLGCKRYPNQIRVTLPSKS
jgi:hypothetical protein